MKRLVTREQIRAIDGQAQHSGLSAAVLMEAAACRAWAEIRKNFYPHLVRQGQIVIVCGRGHNGGDGYALARQLANEGFSVHILEPGSELARSELTRQQRNLCLRQGILCESFSAGQARAEIGCTLLVDALFGIGLDRLLAGEDLAAVSWINQLSSPKVSLDIPSGLDGDRGIPLPIAVRADLTITFGWAKPGMYLQEGPNFCGRISVENIFSRQLGEEFGSTISLYDRASAASDLQTPRSPTGHKGDFGRALICAGSSGTWGAALLCAQACSRSGAGYTHLASHEDLRSLLCEFPEVMTSTLSPGPDWKKFDAVAIGPGLGVGEATVDLILSLKQSSIGSVVIDADAFTASAQHKLYPFIESWIATPHAAELSRLLKKSTEEISSDRLACAVAAAKLIGCCLVLKGRFSCVAHPSGQVRIIAAGNSALAKAGSGDVLTGLLIGLLAQSRAPDALGAASLACYLHGRLADEWVEEGLSDRSLQPSDLVARLPKLLREF